MYQMLMYWRCGSRIKLQKKSKFNLLKECFKTTIFMILNTSFDVLNGYQYLNDQKFQ